MKKAFVILFAVTLLSACSREAAPYDQFAQCLTDKGVKMYGTNTCPYCTQQKKLFKGSFDLVNFIECNADPKACQAAEVKAYPTWEFGDKKTEGRKSLSELAELSNCPLNAAEEKVEEVKE